MKQHHWYSYKACDLVTWTQFHFPNILCVKALTQFFTSSQQFPTTADNPFPTPSVLSLWYVILLCLNPAIFLIIFAGPKSSQIFNMDSNNWRVKRETAEIPSKEQTRTPMRSYQQRRSNLNDSSFGGNSSSPFGNGRRSFPFQDQSRDGLRKPLNDDKVDRAIEEGRRVYVGNLPYEVSLVHSLPLRDWSCRSPWPIGPPRNAVSNRWRGLSDWHF
jgi:hypothetical protein